MRTLTLTQLISQAKSRADMLRSGFVSTAEWTDYLNAGVAELWHALKDAYGEEWFQLYNPFTTVSGTDEYDLPHAQWGLKAVEIEIGGLWYPVHRFGLPDRLQYQMLPAVVSGARLNNIKYALWGSKLKLIPPPDGAYSMRTIYEPVPDRLATLTCAAASVNTSTNTLAIASHGLRTDQLVRPAAGSAVGSALPSGLRSDTDYWVIVTDADNIQLAANPAGGGTATAVSLGSTGTGTHTIDCVLDGVAGWEEWPLLSAAIKAKGKADQDTSELRTQLFGIPGDPAHPGIMGMIKAAAKQRDTNEPMRITNVHAPFSMDAYLLGEW